MKVLPQINLTGITGSLGAVPVYVFGESGNYTGLMSRTDESGEILFQLPVGVYTFRADYEANQFRATGEVLADQAIPILLDISGGQRTLRVLDDKPTVLESGVLSLSAAPNTNKVQVDYFGQQYLTESPAALDTTVDIGHGKIELTLRDRGGVLSNVQVYLFITEGRYLGLTQTSDRDGKVSFTVPAGSYKLRVDHLANKYWTELINVIESDVEAVDFEIGDISATTVNNPFPVRSDIKAVDVKIDDRSVTPVKKSLRRNKSFLRRSSVKAVDFEISDSPATTVSNSSPTRSNSGRAVDMPLLASSGSTDGAVSADTISTEAKAYYYISDHLSTAQLLTNDTGEVVWQGDYSPFGDVNIIIDEVGNNFRFPGQYFDAESGLYYNWHRFYDPEMGRYINADPIGLAGGMNLYAYVGGDPVNFVDPMGLVDLNLHDRNTSAFLANHLYSDPNNYTVGAHGSPSKIANDRRGLENRETLSPAQLAQMINDQDNYNGQDIKLLASETGKGDDSFAEQLARELGLLGHNVQVSASSEGVSIGFSSMRLVGSNTRTYNLTSVRVENGGHWNNF